MRLISYDCEVFAYDWLVTLKDKETGVYTCIWNDNEALKMALSDDCIYVGFNSKHYDQYIIKAIAAGFAPEEIKKVNDFIIAGGQGWQCPLLDGIYFRFSNVDIRDDTQQGLSLKAIEGHLGMSVKESSVPFDIDRPLTPEEKAETEFYCKHDVDTAERLIDIWFANAAARSSSPRNTAIRPGFTAPLAVSGRNGSRRTRYDFSIVVSK